MEKQELAGFKRLRVWQKAYDLALASLQVDQRSCRKKKCTVLHRSFSRAAASVAANISEGYERNHRKEYVQFLDMAKGW